MTVGATDEKYMRRALFLAKKGGSAVAPNPMVGAVIVYNDKIIGEGYHKQYGDAHAEVNAVRAVENQALLKYATIYVTLEPCAHFGKTPPCADLIIQHQFHRVVVACIDPFAEVAGKGVQKMRDAGINVVIGVLEQEAKRLNKRFFTFHQKKRPYVVLKWAQTSDGFMDKKRIAGDTGINWITQPETKTLVHALRAENAGILVGVNTIISDNPTLNVRHHFGRHPHRFILDPNGRIPVNAKVLNTENQPTTILHKQPNVRDFPKVQQLVLPKYSLSEILLAIYQQHIHSVLVEGGAQTLKAFLAEDLWDEAHIFSGKNTFTEGLPAPRIPSGIEQKQNIGADDYRVIYSPTSFV